MMDHVTRSRSWLFAVAAPSLALVALGGVFGCSSGASSGVGGFGSAFGYGDGGGYQGTTTAVTVTAEASSSVSSSASTTTSVTASSSTGITCPDSGPGEPNDTIAQAYNLGTISDNDSDGAQVKGTITSPSDVDWYKYHGVDLFGNVVDPTRQLLSPGLRTCKYIECDNAEANVFSCPSGSMPDTQSGHPGCCWTGASPITLDLTCGSSSLDSDNATVYVRVDDPTALVCQAYTLSYHY